MALKLVHPTVEHLEHRELTSLSKMTFKDLIKTSSDYAEHKGKSFFPGMIKYMSSGPVVAMVWEGLEAVKTGRAMLGATNPLASPPGSIRGDYALAVGRNICHGSDSVSNAEKEIKL